MDITLSLSAICEAICADQKLFGDISFVTTDSRQACPGSLFVALRGERFDGHQFIGQALAKGARCVVADTPGDYLAERTLLVGNTERALRRIAALYRSRLRTKIVAVTGSVGKTSTRDMAAAVLSSAYRTTKTQGNLNNQVGVPQTVLAIDRTHQAAVVEMGMSGFGEIEEISLCASPDVAIITNIGVSHMERLGSREGIFRAKTEIVRGLRPGAPLILNGDDDLLCTYRNPDCDILLFGIDNPRCAVRASDIQDGLQETLFVIHYAGECYPARIPALGRHNVLNALAGFAAGVALGIAPEQAARALGEFEATGMRQRMVTCGGFTVVEDCYNASPDSFRAALHTLAQRPCAGRRILIAADMLELGDIAAEAHRAVGTLAGELGIDAVYTFGELGREIAVGAAAGGVPDVRQFTNKPDLAADLAAAAKPGDLLWFKASRGMKLEDVIETVYEERGK